MLIQLENRTLHSNNRDNLSSDNGCTRRLSKVTSSKLQKLIQAVLIQLEDHTLCSGNDGTLRSDYGCAGCLSKVTSSKL